jgi:hypothetical protein
VSTGTPMIGGVVRVGFGTLPHRGVLFDPASAATLARVINKLS